MRISKLIITATALAILAIFTSPAQVNATSGFKPGRIIDDVMFTSKSSMSVDQIQDFLNSKVPTCDTNGEQNSEYGGPDLNGDGRVQRWEWGKANYNQTTFPCLRDYRVEDGRSAAQVIYDAAQTYTISPRVLIVLLQKEQGLITDTWPLNIQYRSATGYGCPDTAPCDSQYYGLVNQIKWAATMFRAILDDSPTWYTPYELGDNYIQYNPNADCGGSIVNIQNRSTQALYNYTPYQPNQATLDAGWGVAPCGAYGNLRFYQYFTSWFGAITTDQLTFSPLSDPRYLELVNDSSKINVETGQVVGGTLGAGLQRKFTTKLTYADGYQCLRTESDTTNNLPYCIPIRDLGKLKPVYNLLSAVTLYEVNGSDRYKIGLERNEKQLGPFRDAWQIPIIATTTIDSRQFLVTEHDYSNGILSGIPAEQMSTTPTYSKIDPVWYEFKGEASKVTPLSNRMISGPFPSGLIRMFNSRANVNGTWYYRTDTDTSEGNSRAISESLLQTPSYLNFSMPRWMTINKQTTAYSPSTGKTVGSTVNKDTQYKFVSKITINNIEYYRTESDTNSNNDIAFKAVDISNMYYVPFSAPRELKLAVSSNKSVPVTGAQSDGPFAAGLTRKYTSKIYVNGQWYYRTETDEQWGLNKAFPASSLVEVYQ